MSDAISAGNNLYLVDIFDIIIISIMVYFALLFLKHTRSLLAFLGVGFLLVFYIAAQAFNLYLTSLVLQTFSGIFLIILVIVFQDELRRFFELLAVIGTRPGRPAKKGTLATAIATEIGQAVAHLAKEKRGALIVLQGLESLDRHLEGGEALDSLINDTILESIFDPHSIGHDGAVVINRNRITRFGAHLPLSINMKEVRRKGTRHTAALGISEATDALAIVVSEERGDVSIAYDGKLRTLKGPEEVSGRVAKFLRENFPEKPISLVGGFIKKNPYTKLGAVLLAVALWFSFLSQAETVQKDFVVPIVYRGVPQEFIVENTVPSEVVVTLAGRGAAVFSRLEPTDLEIVIDGKNLHRGANTIILEKDFLSLPFYISVIDFSPLSVRITAEEYAIYELPVEVQLTGELANEREMESTQTSPQRIEILVPESVIPPSRIFTEPVSLEGVDKTFSVKTRFVLPAGTRLKKDAKNEVTVTVNVR